MNQALYRALMLAQVVVSLPETSTAADTFNPLFMRVWMSSSPSATLKIATSSICPENLYIFAGAFERVFQA